MKKNIQQQKGIGIIEIIVCLAIIAVTFIGFLELVHYNLNVQEQSRMRIEALNLAVEAIEATRSVRDENWDNFSSLNFDTEYYPLVSSGKWTLDPANPGLINNLYDRWIILERVYRDANSDISSAGDEDPETRKITAVVEWNYKGKTRQIDIATYLTNWANQDE